MAAMTQAQPEWFKEFFGFDLGAAAMGGTVASPGSPAPIDSGPAPGGASGAVRAFTTEAPQPGTGRSGHDDSDLTFTSGYSLFWTGPDSASTIVPLRGMHPTRLQGAGPGQAHAAPDYRRISGQSVAARQRVLHPGGPRSPGTSVPTSTVL
jgi:hypothetical protein